MSCMQQSRDGCHRRRRLRHPTYDEGGRRTVLSASLFLCNPPSFLPRSLNGRKKEEEWIERVAQQDSTQKLSCIHYERKIHLFYRAHLPNSNRNFTSISSDKVLLIHLVVEGGMEQLGNHLTAARIKQPFVQQGRQAQVLNGVLRSPASTPPPVAI